MPLRVIRRLLCGTLKITITYIFYGRTPMNIETSLFSLSEGMCARVTKLKNDGSMRRRLQDLGLIEGTRVKCLQRSPSGDPTAYLIRGAVIALREEDSSKIMVETT